MPPTRYLRILLLALGISWKFPGAAIVIAAVALILFCFYREKTKVAVSGGHLYIYKGVLLNRSASIKVSDVTSIVVTRSLFDIIARTADFAFFTQAGAVCGREGIKFSIKSEKNLCDKLGFTVGVREKKSSLSQTLLQALSTPSVATGVVFLLPIMRKIDMLLNDNETTADKIKEIGETFFGMSPLMNLAATFVLIAFVISLLLFVMRYAGHTSNSTVDSATVSFGILPKGTVYIRKSAFDITAEVQPPLLFFLKKSFVKAGVAGLKNEKKCEVYLSPPRAQTKKAQKPYMCGETWQYFKGSFCFFCFGAVVLLAAHILFPELSDLLMVLFSVMTAALYYRFHLAKYAHRHTNIDLCAGTAHFVRGARVTCTEFSPSKIGMIQTTTYPYDRKKRLCTVKTVMRSENATKIKAKYVSAEEVAEQVKSLYKK